MTTFLLFELIKFTVLLNNAYNFFFLKKKKMNPTYSKKQSRLDVLSENLFLI